MVLGIEHREALSGHMGIDLSGGDVGVAQQQLDRSKIGPVV